MFADETTMARAFRDWVEASWPDESAVALPEHRIGRRIADLVVASVDLDRAAKRLAAGLNRELTTTELHVVRSAPRARPLSSTALSRKTGIEDTQLNRLLARLVNDGFLLQAERGGIRRSPGYSAPVTRIVTFEIKRDRWRDAFHQAKAHQPYSQASWVVFDQTYVQRFLGSR